MYLPKTLTSNILIIITDRFGGLVGFDKGIFNAYW